MFSQGAKAFLFKTLGDQIKADAVNPLGGCYLLRRQTRLQRLAKRICKEFFPRSFVNINLREKRLEAWGTHAAAASPDPAISLERPWTSARRARSS